MAKVETDILVDLEDVQSSDRVPDLPLNLKSVSGDVSKNITSSLSTPGSSFYTSGASEGIQTSAKTRSRLSSIFLKHRTTIWNDDDPFDLKPIKTKAVDGPIDKDSSNSTIITNSVRTGVLVSIREDSTDEIISNAVTDWDSLKFEAQAIVGDIQLSTKKARIAKHGSEESKRLHFSMLSPDYCGDMESSILHLSDSEDNECIIDSKAKRRYQYPEDEESNYESRGKENSSLNSNNISPIKLLDFSACDISDLDVDITEGKSDCRQTNDITNMLSLVKLPGNINDGKKVVSNSNLIMQHPPDVVTNTTENICGSITTCGPDVVTNTGTNLRNCRRKSLFSKPTSIYHFAAPLKPPNDIVKKPVSQEMMPPKSEHAESIRSGLAKPMRRMSMQANHNTNYIRKPITQSRNQLMPAEKKKTITGSLTGNSKTKSYNASSSLRNYMPAMAQPPYKLPTASKSQSSAKSSNTTKITGPATSKISNVGNPSNKVVNDKHRAIPPNLSNKLTQKRYIQTADSKQRDGIQSCDVIKGVKDNKIAEVSIKSGLIPSAKSKDCVYGTRSMKSALNSKQQTKSNITINKDKSKNGPKTEIAGNAKHLSPSTKMGDAKLNNGLTYNLSEVLNEFNSEEEKAKIGVERNQQFTTKNNGQSLPAFASTSNKESQERKINGSSVATRTRIVQENTAGQKRRSVIPQPRGQAISKMSGSLSRTVNKK